MKKKASPPPAGTMAPKSYDGLFVGIRELLFERMQLLCESFPPAGIAPTLSRQLARRSDILQTLSAKSQILSTLSIELAAPIRATLSLETQVPPIGSTPSSKSKCVKIGPTLSDQSLALSVFVRLALPDEKKLLQTIQEARQQVERAAHAKEVRK